MIVASRRTALPQCSDRIRLGRSELEVSPVCLGIVGTADTVLAAYEAGVNFFFVTGDLHWPIYAPLRQGLVELFKSDSSIRQKIVVAVVSYLRQPMFSYLQFHEVIDSVPGLEYIDVVVGGAVSDEFDSYERNRTLETARVTRHLGAQCSGCSFHDRRSALISLNSNALDINFVRYNPAHPKAQYDLFPFVRPDRTGALFNFKSTLPGIQSASTAEHRVQHHGPRPAVTDYYRFALTTRAIDGVLCAWNSPAHVDAFVKAMASGPLTPQEEAHLVAIAASRITAGEQRTQGKG